MSLLFALAGFVAQAATVWVSPAGREFPGYAGVAAPDRVYATVHDALYADELADGDVVVLDREKFDIVKSDGDVISGLQLKKSVTVTGVGRPEETVLDGGEEVDGRQWKVRHWPFIQLQANGVVFRNMTFERMGTDGASALSVANGFADCVISNMIFRNTGHGYTVRAKQSYLVDAGNKNTVVSGCVFTNNCWGASLVHIGGGAGAGMANCLIADNVCTGENGGRSGELLFFNHGAYRGQGFIANNTIVNNRSKTGAVRNASFQSATVANNIIWGNRSLDGTQPLNFGAFGSGNADLYVCNCLEEQAGASSAQGNIFVAPLFEEDGFHLRTDSPCRWTGSPVHAPAGDLAGNARPATPSMGCVETIGMGPAFIAKITASATNTVPPLTVTLGAKVFGDARGELSYAWDLDGDGDFDDATAGSPVLADVGTYRVALRVTDGTGTAYEAKYDGAIVIAEGKTVHAKDFGWDPANATEALQKAIDSGASTVIVDAMPSPWYIGKINLKGNQTIRLEKGARIHAYLPQWEENKKKALFHICEGVSNFTLEGAGPEESLIGSFESKEQRLKYCKAGQELQTGIYIDMLASNIVVRNLSLAHCGCDGMSTGGWRIPSYNVLVENVDMWDNHRQACSPMVADGLVFRRCKFRDTTGTEPAAGADMEPCYDVHPLRGVVFEECEFGNNDGGGLITPMSSIYPIDVTVRRCTFHPEKGRSPVDILARGDTYLNRDTPADVKLVFEDCVIETYANCPGIEFTTAPIFSCDFRNVTIKEVPGRSVWKPNRKCSPIEFRLDRDYHGAFPPSKAGKVVFDNLSVTGFEGRPLIQYVDFLGKQEVIGYFSGSATFNGEKVDMAEFDHKATDLTEPLPRRFPVQFLEEPAADAKTLADLSPSNCKLVPWGDWYEPRPCYNYYFHAEKGETAAFSVIYPKNTDTVDFSKKLMGVHLDLLTSSGKVDLGELAPGTNAFTYAVTETGWHAFFPPCQDSEGNNVRADGADGTRLVCQADSVGTGEVKFELRDPAKDYAGYFEVPAGVECRLRVSRGTVELRDPTGKVVEQAVENDYAGRKILSFRATGDKTEVWSFRTPAGGGTRVLRFYAPLNGIFADAPELLPRIKENPPDVKEEAFEMETVGHFSTNLLPRALTGTGPFGDGYSLTTSVTILGTTPDEHCDPLRGGSRNMCVSLFKRNGKSVRFYWYSDGRANEHPGFDLLTLNIPEPIPDPVWIDTRTGEVCAIGKRNSVRDGSRQILRQVPIRMTPIAICDRSAFPEIK